MQPRRFVVAGPPFLHTLSTAVDPGLKEANGTEGSRWLRTVRKPFSKFELYVIASATGSGYDSTLPPGGRKASIGFRGRQGIGFYGRFDPCKSLRSLEIGVRHEASDGQKGN